MSRIGRLPIPVPSGVTVDPRRPSITVKGPKGELHRDLHPDMLVAQEDGALVVNRPDEDKFHAQLHGLTRTLVANMVAGVTDGLPQGHRDHRRRLSRPEGRRQAPAQPRLQPPDRDRSARRASPSRSRTRPASRSSGIDKELVGQIAARVRATRKPEPYKGKGVRYAGEKIRRKAGKAGKIGGKK